MGLLESSFEQVCRLQEDGGSKTTEKSSEEMES